MNSLNPNDPKDIKSISKSREITKEILSFGVSQKEIIKVIELLSLELEDTTLMREIKQCLQLNLKDKAETKKEILV